MTQDLHTPDTAQFAGEPMRTGLSRDLKMKLAMGLGALVFALASAAYVRHRLEGINLGAKATAAANSPEAMSQRKTKVFEADNSPPIKPPIVLPPETPALPAASAALPAGFSSAFSAGFPDERATLPKPPPPQPVMKPMMLGEANSSAYPQAGAALSTPRVTTPVSAAKGGDLATLLGITTGEKEKEAPTPGGEANKLTNPNPNAGSSNAVNGTTGKALNQTVEAQAQIAREKAGSQVTGTAQVSASKLGRRSFVLAKGAFIPCVLETQLVSNVFGMTSCVVTQNVYSDDGKVLLIERGSRVTGNYGSNLRNGDSRLAVVWDRIKTPKGITVDVNSPATDGVGAMGMSGVVDKHWFERIAGAIMLSLIQDTIQYATSSIAYKTYLKEQKDNATTQLPVQMANTSNSTVTTTSVDPVTGDTITTVTNSGQSPVAQGARSSSANPPPVPVFGGSNTTKQGASIPEQVLAASINATPTLYKNRGDVVFIFVANDLWFDRVYGLKE